MDTTKDKIINNNFTYEIKYKYSNSIIKNHNFTITIIEKIMSMGYIYDLESVILYKEIISILTEYDSKAIELLVNIKI